MVKIKIKFNKTAQQFFYISNLSEWSFACSFEYNARWEELTGSLKTEEINILKQLKPVFQKYDFNDKNPNRYLGTPFINSAEKDIWKNAADLLRKSELIILKSAFKIFKHKFNILWKKDKIRLEKISGNLSKKVKKYQTIKIIKHLESLFGQPLDNFTIYIFAAPVKSIHIGGGANTGKNIITLELRSQKDADDGILIAFHEISHQLFRNLKLNLGFKSKKVKKRLSRIPLFKEQGFKSALEELTLCSLLPNGILASYYHDKFKIRSLKTYNVKKQSDLENYVIRYSGKIIRGYFKSGKIIDEKYVDFILQIALKFAESAKNKKGC